MENMNLNPKFEAQNPKQYTNFNFSNLFFALGI